jgi:hypothetical protein
MGQSRPHLAIEIIKKAQTQQKFKVLSGLLRVPSLDGFDNEVGLRLDVSLSFGASGLKNRDNNVATERYCGRNESQKRRAVPQRAVFAHYCHSNLASEVYHRALRLG